MDKNMNTETLKRVGKYCLDLEQFALGLHDEMKGLEMNDWVNVAKKLLDVAVEMQNMKNVALTAHEARQ